MNEHLDDFTLLRHSAGELNGTEHRAVAAHLEECAECRRSLEEIRLLDSELQSLARDGDLAGEGSDHAFSPSDPFRHRPRVAVRGSRRTKKRAALGADAVLASDAGITSSDALLETLHDLKRLPAAIRRISFERPDQRFALLYALKESARRIAEGPLSALEFAGAALQRLRREASDRESPAEQMVPWSALWVQAHVLAAQAHLWTKQFQKSRAHLVTAYRALARGDGDETSFAYIELIESQRRFFSGEPDAALALASRARHTFDSYGLEDLAARATVAEGLALRGLGRFEDAVQRYRLALPVFERYELWSNYVGALNSLGTALHQLGRLDEARREYARALRRFSREQHRSWLGYLQYGLAEVLFSGRRFRHAAMSLSRAARYFADVGLRASALLAKLHEIESWARHGDVPRARHRLELFVNELAKDRTLDRTVALQLAQALSGEHPDFERIGILRQEAEQQIQRRAPQVS
jgi:tetratricopeptide (TPR) repeat protein